MVAKMHIRLVPAGLSYLSLYQWNKRNLPTRFLQQDKHLFDVSHCDQTSACFHHTTTSQHLGQLQLRKHNTALLTILEMRT